MMLKATKPKWVNAEKTMIECVLKHPVFGPIPFTASPNDVEDQGRELFARIVAGDFGPVADFNEPATQEAPEPK